MYSVDNFLAQQTPEPSSTNKYTDERIMGHKAKNSSPSPNAPDFSSGDITISELPLALPDRDTPLPPGHKTLLDIIEEKRPRDSRGDAIVPTRRRRKSGEGAGGKKEGDEGVREEEDGDGVIEMEDLVGPLGMAFFYTVPLTLTLAAFEVVVHQQYIQDIEWSVIGIKCLKAFPSMFFVSYQNQIADGLHPRS